MTENTEKMLRSLASVTADIYCKGTDVDLVGLAEAIFKCCSTAYAVGRADECHKLNMAFIEAQGKESVVREG